MDKIDLRSDTVTWPTPQMRQAMAQAVVGDDVYGEDPTVNRLEALAAERFGKEAALFVASGSMGNTVALLSHCGRGDEAIMGNPSHTFKYEGGNPASLGGVHSMPLAVQPNGEIALDDIRHAIREDDPHYPRTRLVSLENTQGSLGGLALSRDYIESVAEICQAHDLKLHIDGARIFNAATALGESVADLTAAADSLTFCLSKGLCAPVGSLVVGSAEFIYHARRMRKVLGGGMRQAGIIAAAGIIALEEMSQRLAEDHEHAYTLAEGLAEFDSIRIDPDRVQTNMFFFTLKPDAPLSPQALIEKMAEHNILIQGSYDTGFFRFVTHYWIGAEQVEKILYVMRSLLQ